MQDPTTLTPAAAIARIPMDLRPLIIDWLAAWEDRAEQMVRSLRRGKTIETANHVEQMCNYWNHYASACRDLQKHMRQSSQVPDRAPGGEKHVRGK